MDLKTSIKKYLNEAELYKGQGLYNEADKKYRMVEDLLWNAPNLKNRDKLVEGIRKKIDDLQTLLGRVDTAPVTPEMTANVQDLIKKLFSFSNNPDPENALIEGAVALAKFGQYERAITEFTALLKNEAVCVDAAKNILRCYIAQENAAQAVDQLRQWIVQADFAGDHMEKIHAFLKSQLEQKGIDIALPELAAAAASSVDDDDDDEFDEDEVLDISSIGITLEDGPDKGKQIELDVSFQTGNTISLIIAAKNKNLIEHLNVDARLKKVQYYSPIAVFQGSGVIVDKTQISSGPKKGDYSVDIKIEKN